MSLQKCQIKRLRYCNIFVRIYEIVAHIVTNLQIPLLTYLYKHVYVVRLAPRKYSFLIHVKLSTHH